MKPRTSRSKLIAALRGAERAAAYAAGATPAMVNGRAQILNPGRRAVEARKPRNVQVREAIRRDLG